MTQSFEIAKSRFDNISAIKPLLSALRTLSMGAWQMALNKLSKMDQYQDHFIKILAQILPYIKERQIRKHQNGVTNTTNIDTILLIVGTERGLCGKFNQTLAENAVTWLKSQDFPSYEIWAMGTRLIRELERMRIDITWKKSFQTSDASSYQAAYMNAQKWLEQFESYQFNRLMLIYNEMNRGQIQFSTIQLLPYQLDYATQALKTETSWPPPIIESDPTGIYHQIIQHFIASSFYQVLLKSTVAEHSTRYNLMQESIDNAEDIIEELQLIINAERKKQITQEMQELATGAGLLD